VSGNNPVQDGPFTSLTQGKLQYGNWTGPEYSANSKSPSFVPFSTQQTSVPGIDPFDKASAQHDIDGDNAQADFLSNLANGMSGSQAMVTFLQANQAADLKFASAAAGAGVDYAFGLTMEGIGVGVMTLKAQAEGDLIAQIQQPGSPLAAQLDSWAEQYQAPVNGGPSQAQQVVASNQAYLGAIQNNGASGFPTDQQAEDQRGNIVALAGGQGSAGNQLLDMANSLTGGTGILLAAESDSSLVPAIIASGVGVVLMTTVGTVGEAIQTIYDGLSSVVNWGASEISSLLGGVADLLGLPTSATTFSGDGPVGLVANSDGSVTLSQTSEGATTSLDIGGSDLSVGAIKVSPGNTAGEFTAQVYPTDGSAFTLSGLTAAPTVDDTTGNLNVTFSVGSGTATVALNPTTGAVANDPTAVTATIGGETVTLLGLGGSSPFALISNDNSVTAGAPSSYALNVVAGTPLPTEGPSGSQLLQFGSDGPVFAFSPGSNGGAGTYLGQIIMEGQTPAFLITSSGFEVLAPAQDGQPPQVLMQVDQSFSTVLPVANPDGTTTWAWPNSGGGTDTYTKLSDGTVNIGTSSTEGGVITASAFNYNPTTGAVTPNAISYTGASTGDYTGEFVGSAAASLIGQLYALGGGSNPFVGITATALSTALETQGNWYQLGQQNQTAQAAEAAAGNGDPGFIGDFGAGFAAAGIGYELRGLIAQDGLPTAANALINGTTNAALTVFTQQLIDNLNSGISLGDAITNATSAAGSLDTLANGAESAAIQYIAGKVLTAIYGNSPNAQEIQIGEALGSAGGALAGLIWGEEIGGALFPGAGNLLGPVVGMIIGAIISSAFGPDSKPVDPNVTAWVSGNGTNFIAGPTGTDNGGSLSTAQAMQNQALLDLQTIQTYVGGTFDISGTSSTPQDLIKFGYFGNPNPNSDPIAGTTIPLQYYDSSDTTNSGSDPQYQYAELGYRSSDPSIVEQQGVWRIIENTPVQAATNAYAAQVLVADQNDSMDQLQSDLAVAQQFQSYQQNQSNFLDGLSGDSQKQALWATQQVRAQQLGLGNSAISTSTVTSLAGTIDTQISSLLTSIINALIVSLNGQGIATMTASVNGEGPGLQPIDPTIKAALSDFAGIVLNLETMIASLDGATMAPGAPVMTYEWSAASGALKISGAGNSIQGTNADNTVTQAVLASLSSTVSDYNTFSGGNTATLNALATSKPTTIAALLSAAATAAASNQNPNSLTQFYNNLQGLSNQITGISSQLNAGQSLGNAGTIQFDYGEITFYSLANASEQVLADGGTLMNPNGNFGFGPSVDTYDHEGTISNANGLITMGQSDTLTVTGDNDSITTTNNGTLTLTGSGDLVNAGSATLMNILAAGDNEIITPGSDAQVTLAGTSNTVLGANAPLLIANVGGLDNSVTGLTAGSNVTFGGISDSLIGGSQVTVNVWQGSATADGLTNSTVYLADSVVASVQGNSDLIHGGQSDALTLSGVGMTASLTDSSVNLDNGSVVYLSSGQSTATLSVATDTLRGNDNTVNVSDSSFIVLDSNLQASVNGTYDVIHGGTGDDLSLTGNNEGVVMSSSTLVLDGATNAYLGGSLNLVVEGEGSNNLQINGTDNVVVGNDDTGTYALSGGYNTVSLNNDSNVINVNGVADTLSLNGSNEQITESGTGELITTTGAGDVVVLSGQSDTLTLTAGTLEVAAGVTATISGVDELIDVSASDSLTLSGAGNTFALSSGISFVSGASSQNFTGTSDTLTLSGAGNTLALTNSAINLQSNIDEVIAGSGNTITGTLGDTVSFLSNVSASVGGGTLTIDGTAGDSLTITGNEDSVVLSNGTITLEAGETIYLSGTGDVINKNGGTVVQLGASALPPSGNSAVSITAPMSRTFLGLASSGPSVGEPGGGGSVVLWGTTNEIDGSGYSIAAQDEFSGTVNGTSNQISLGNGEYLTVNGGGNAFLFGGSGSSVTANGDGNSFGISGTSNSVTANGGGDQALIAGSGTSFNNAAGDTIEVAAGVEAVINGIDNSISVDAGAAVTLGGGGNDFVIASNASLTANGLSNTISIAGSGASVQANGSGDEIEIKGNSDNVSVGGDIVSLDDGMGGAVINGINSTISLGNADQATINGGGNQASIVGNGSSMTANGNGNTLSANGSSNAITANGSGDIVALAGTGNSLTIQAGQISISDNGGITVHGGQNIIGFNNGVTLNVLGSGNQITAGGSGNVTTVNGVSSTVTESGSNENVTLYGGNNSVSFTGGNSNTLLADGDSETLSITGNSDYVQANGLNDDVSLSGQGNSLTMADGSVSLANGAQATANGVGDQIVLNGSDSFLFNGGDNSYTLNGADNALTENGSNNVIHANGGSDSLTINGLANVMVMSGSGGTVQTGNGTVELADNAQVNVGGVSDDLVLGNGDTLTFGGNSSTGSVTGSGSTITVNGLSDTLSASGTADTLTLNGGTNTATLTGTGDLLTTNGVSETLTDNGFDNQINGNGAGDVITINGSGDTVITASATINVGNGGQATADGQSNKFNVASSAILTINASGNTVKVNGNNSTVTANGTGNTVSTSGNGNTVTVNGGGNTLSLSGSGGSLTGNGDGNDFNVTGMAAAIAANGLGDVVSLAGTGNTLTIGNGTVNVASSAQTTIDGVSDQVTLGSNDQAVTNGGTFSIEVNGSGDTLTANGSSNTLTVTGNSNSITANGQSVSVAIGGQNDTLTTADNSISIADGSTITLFGGGDTITAGNNEQITVSSSTNTITLSGTSDMLTVNGVLDSIAVNGDSDAVVVNGNSDTISASGNSDSLTLNGTDDLVVVSGGSDTVDTYNNVLDLTGTAIITLNGGGNIVSLHTGDTLTVTGSNNWVNAVAGNSVTLTGSGEGAGASGAGATVTFGGTGQYALLNSDTLTVQSNDQGNLTGNANSVTLNAGSVLAIQGYDNSVAANGATLTLANPVAGGSDGFSVNGFAFPSYSTGTYGSAAATSSLQSVTQTGANAVELNVTQYVANASGTTIASTSDTESDANLLAEISQAQSDGLQVFLAPHLNSEDGTWSAQLAPSNVAQFFANYQTFIVHYAQLAQQAGVGLFAIGNEMGALTDSQYLPYWTSIISAVRKVYSGKLTYDSAWTETGSVSFWSQLDVIGANAYTPPTNITNPSVSQLVAGWTSTPSDPGVAAATDNMSPLAFYQSLASTYGKQVLFTEIGYQAVNGTNLLAGAAPGSSNYTDFQQQANALQAFYQVMGANSGSWLDGAYLWDWNPNQSQVNPNDFSVQSKPALSVINSAFGSTTASGPSSPNTVTGNNNAIALADGVTGTISGTGNTITLGNSDTLTVTGASDTLTLNGADDTASLSGGVVFATSGAQVSVTASGFTIGSDTVNGTADTLALSDGTATLASGVTAVVIGNSDALSGGTSDTLTLTGTGDTISLSGAMITAENGDIATLSGTSNTLQFGPNISIDQLWLAESGQDLDVTVIGTTESMTIANWYGGNSSGWTFETSDGHTLAANQVANLVSAMAGVTQPSLGQTTLPNTQPYQNLETTIAANWQA
jgi:hypothetical protein